MPLTCNDEGENIVNSYPKGKNFYKLAEFVTLLNI